MYLLFDSLHLGNIIHIIFFSAMLLLPQQSVSISFFLAGNEYFFPFNAAHYFRFPFLSLLVVHLGSNISFLLLLKLIWYVSAVYLKEEKFGIWPTFQPWGIIYHILGNNCNVTAYERKSCSTRIKCLIFSINYSKTKVLVLNGQKPLWHGGYKSSEMNIVLNI